MIIIYLAQTHAFNENFFFSCLSARKRVCDANGTQNYSNALAQLMAHEYIYLQNWNWTVATLYWLGAWFGCWYTTGELAVVVVFLFALAMCVICCCFSTASLLFVSLSGVLVRSPHSFSFLSSALCTTVPSFLRFPIRLCSQALLFAFKTKNKNSNTHREGAIHDRIAHSTAHSTNDREQERQSAREKVDPNQPLSIHTRIQWKHMRTIYEPATTNHRVWRWRGKKNINTHTHKQTFV